MCLCVCACLLVCLFACVGDKLFCCRVALLCFILLLVRVLAWLFSFDCLMYLLVRLFA